VKHDAPTRVWCNGNSVGRYSMQERQANERTRRCSPTTSCWFCSALIYARRQRNARQRVTIFALISSRWLRGRKESQPKWKCRKILDRTRESGRALLSFGGESRPATKFTVRSSGKTYAHKPLNGSVLVRVTTQLLCDRRMLFIKLAVLSSVIGCPGFLHFHIAEVGVPLRIAPVVRQIIEL